MTISSQAIQECVEGSTTRVWSPDRTVKPHERTGTKVCKCCNREFEVTKSLGRSAKCGLCLKEIKHQRYVLDKARMNERSRAYYAQNKEEVLRQKSEYGKRPEVSERDKARRRERYAIEHQFAAKTKIRRDKYYGKNSEVFRARDAKRRAIAACAFPKWADKAKIRAIYKQALEITKSTGIRHEVDHVIPICGRNVCGLHVETNLRVIPMLDNRRKFNKLVQDIV